MKYQHQHVATFAHRPFVLLALVSALLMILSGCTTSVRSIDGLSTERPVIERSPEPGENETALSKLSAQELVARGDSYLGQGNDKVARIHYIMALKRDGKNVPAIVGLGKIQHRQGKFENAKKTFGRALELEPTNLAALLGQARTVREQGDATAAIEYLERALVEQPENPEVLSDLAFAHDALGEPGKAEGYYRQVVELHPGRASAHNNLGFSYLLQERYDEAIAAFGRALGIDPGDTKAANNLGTAYALRGDADKALQIFKSKLGPAAAYNNLGYLYMTQSRWELAEKAFRRALDLSPTFYVKARQNLDRLEHLRSTSRN